MVVLHDLIHSSEFIKILVGGGQVAVLLASRSAINSPYSFELEFCISSFFSDIQICSILPSKFFFIPLFQFFRRICVVPLVKYHSIFSSSCSILSLFSRSSV